MCLGPKEPEQAPPYTGVPDPEEDLEEDYEEDPADYPADRGDDDDDAEEEEHLAPADPAVVAYSADQDPYLAYRVTARMSIRPQAPAPFLSEEVRDALPSPIHETEMPEMWLPLRKRLCRTTPGPGYEVGESSAAGTARQVGPTTARRQTFNGLLNMDDHVESHPGIAFIQEIAPTTLEGVNQRVTELATTVDQELATTARQDRALLRARVNMLYRDRAFHRRTALLTEEEARVSRAAWAQSMDACDQVRSEGISLRTMVMAQQSEITELQAADRRRQSVILDLLKADHRRQRQLVEALKIVKSLKTQMIELQRQQGPAKDPAEPELPEEASTDVEPTTKTLPEQHCYGDDIPEELTKMKGTTAPLEEQEFREMGSVVARAYAGGVAGKTQTTML
ncbi:hypothetical protein Tco_0109297 [Tanacetum coccineum]